MSDARRDSPLRSDIEAERFEFGANWVRILLHIDVDLYEPTRDSIAFLYERMNPGGIVVCDDYGFMTCPGATKAIDEFL
ncbi:MAG TPA: TylF/MycF/NovP-related O-methyltransferase, partial [Vicinamibacterales bacterium]|nr:TylF/MycF/NovP-related O-methyltransferase [Vicinamibacterales bacterium]